MIVSSILLAFGIDAWWNDLKDRQGERQLLESLVDEFSANRDLLDEAIQSHDAIATAARRLAEISSGRTAQPDDELLEDASSALFGHVSTFLSSGSLTAILASGDIGLIRDQAIRHGLASWPSLVEDALEDERAAFAYEEDNLRPYQTEYLPSVWFFLNRDEDIPGARSASVSELRDELAADRLRRILGFRAFIHGAAREEFVSLRNSLDHLVGAMERALGDTAS